MSLEDIYKSFELEIKSEREINKSEEVKLNINLSEEDKIWLEFLEYLIANFSFIEPLLS